MTNKKALAIVLRMAKSLAAIHRAGREREALAQMEAYYHALLED